MVGKTHVGGHTQQSDLRTAMARYDGLVNDFNEGRSSSLPVYDGILLTLPTDRRPRPGQVHGPRAHTWAEQRENQSAEEKKKKKKGGLGNFFGGLKNKFFKDKKDPDGKGGMGGGTGGTGALMVK